MTPTTELRIATHFFPAYYRDLHAIARRCASRENAGWALEPDALVNEAWLRLTVARNVQPLDANHFLALSARTMKRILVDRARARRAAKRDANLMLPAGPGRQHGDYEQGCALRQALARLASRVPGEARVVALRCFGGYSEAECASILSVSVKTVQRRWRSALLQLRELLEHPGANDKLANDKLKIHADRLRPGQSYCRRPVR